MDLHNYETGDYIRPATEDEAKASERASHLDGGAGVILVDGTASYVVGDFDGEE